MDGKLHGPAAWEREMPDYGPVGRVAVISDVHANVPALEAVLAEIALARVDLVVSCGDLTWGAEPDRTVELIAALGARAVCVRGNGDRAVIELAQGTRTTGRPREAWMATQHSAASVEFVAAFPFSVTVRIDGLGAVRFCHGSPRSDTEVVTPQTPEQRFAELASGLDERVLVTGHTHLQFDRQVAGRRSVNPGSVGLPFHNEAPGTAYWALLAEDVELRQTSYDVSGAVQAGPLLGDPAAETIERLLTAPPSPREIIEEAESLVFTD
jgi:predicted phosphodiesterase